MINRKIIQSISANSILAEGKYFVKSLSDAPISSDVLLDVEYSNSDGGQVIQTVFDRNEVYRRKVFMTSNYVVSAPTLSSTTTWFKLSFENVARTNSITFAATATYNIGSSTAAVNNIYTQNAVTVVSDARHKTEISELTEQELQCAIACSKLYRKYKLNAAVDEKGLNAARYHIGVIAQEIVQCFTDHGLDWRKYGIITYEKWDAIEAVEYQAATYHESGHELTPEIQAIEAREAGEIYMVRYDELNCFVNAGIEYRLSRLE